ncbi:hypothetical protein N7537_007416 [Penicillium hordei]|uniref:Uncharacterized protein n=1 Tax=Penicillium hordei TaxID=40994 RepID=A0AAD6GYL3_9EURO|nr:uncharacterized protein N7537_007416 [Penicillium hordei]KAJ5597332.1 hypothetical protein N7537_007416 [Penicillium hordei]
MESGIVQFVVGKDRKRFSIHAALTSSFQSEILQPPTVGELDEIIFGRCFEFVYSGSYSIPSPVFNPFSGQLGNGTQSLKGSVKLYDKPPYKLPIATLRTGLRLIDL